DALCRVLADECGGALVRPVRDPGPGAGGCSGRRVAEPPLPEERRGVEERLYAGAGLDLAEPSETPGQQELLPQVAGCLEVEHRRQLSRLRPRDGEEVVGLPDRTRGHGREVLAGRPCEVVAAED